MPQQSCENLVCRCLRVTEDALLAALATCEIRTLKEITRHTEAGSGCTACHVLLRRYLERHGYACADSPICSVR